MYSPNPPTLLLLVLMLNKQKHYVLIPAPYLKPETILNKANEQTAEQMDAEEGKIILSSNTMICTAFVWSVTFKRSFFIIFTIPNHIPSTPAPCLNVMPHSVNTRYRNTVKSSRSNGWFSGDLFTHSPSSLLEFESWIRRSVRSQGDAPLANEAIISIRSMLVELRLTSIRGN